MLPAGKQRISNVTVKIQKPEENFRMIKEEKNEKKSCLIDGILYGVNNIDNGGRNSITSD